jgi:hypothetical protein
MSGVSVTQHNVAIWPHLAAIKSLVLDSVRSPHTRRAYDRVLTEFLTWYVASGAAGFTKATVQAYRAGLRGARPLRFRRQRPTGSRP